MYELKRRTSTRAQMMKVSNHKALYFDRLTDVWKWQRKGRGDREERRSAQDGVAY